MDREALIQEMMRKGHNRLGAESTIDSRGLEEMWREYMGGAPSGPEDYITSLIKTLTQDIVPPALEFDTEAARRAAEEEWSPYYEQLLQEYLTEVGLGRERSIEDLASGLGLLGARRESYLGEIERESPRIQEAIGGRFSDRGLYLGGERAEKQRQQLEKEKVSRGDYEREYEYKTEQAQLSQERYSADLERKREQRERDLAREREAAITGQVETQREEKYYGWS